jgi:hypothetical protein
MTGGYLDMLCRGQSRGSVGRCRGVQPRSKTSMMIEPRRFWSRACGFEGFDRVPEDNAPVPEVERSITGLGYRLARLCV